MASLFKVRIPETLIPRASGFPRPAMLTRPRRSSRLLLLPPGPEQAFGVQGPPIQGDAGGVWGGAAGVDNAVHWEYVLLHHGGASLRALLPRRRDQEDHHGARQEFQDPMRFLLRTVRAFSPSLIRCVTYLHFLFVLVLGDFGFGAVVSFNLQEHSPCPSLIIRTEDCPNYSVGV